MSVLARILLVLLGAASLAGLGGCQTDAPTASPRADSGSPASESVAHCCTVSLTVTVPEGVGPVYLSGNLQSLGPWKPDALLLEGEGRVRSVQLQVPRATQFEFKFTLGSWAREAVGPTGVPLSNSQLSVDSNTTSSHELIAFKLDPAVHIDDWRGSGVLGTLVYWKDVRSAHLGPARHVSVWLPPGYSEHPTRRYPVLYMSDGQNLFDPRIANTGIDWGVDEAIVELVAEGVIEPLIVVGVWSSSERGPEYSPWHGAPSYARFLIDELMPRVNAEFRTLQGPKHSAHMGSSMGGLLSFYLAIHHPEAFGACACISTHFPLSEAVVAQNFSGIVDSSTPDPAPYVLRDIERGLRVPQGARLWFDHGTDRLDGTYAPSHARVREWLLAEGLQEDLDFVVRAYPGAEHNEASWRARLKDSLRWLYAGSASGGG